MEFIGSIISEAMKNGYITTEMLLLLLNGLVIVGYFKVIKPLKDKIDTIVTIDDIKATSDANTKEGKINLGEIITKLDKIIDNIDEIQDLDGNTYREIVNMRRDVETVKQILNQFQGHMMYGGRRAGDFGNRELR
jgi:uncharacterized protein YdgA (DUF945 family)